jgi:hypothetical protein
MAARVISPYLDFTKGNMSTIFINSFLSSSNWWEPAGAFTVVAAYQPIGAASLEASYTNLANPGTFDAGPGVAPGWDAVNGWSFDGLAKYLRTGIVGSSAVSFLFRFSNCTGSLVTMGAAQSAPTRYTFIRPRTTTNRQIFLSATDSFTKAGALTAGVFGWGGYSVYLDGAPDGTVSGAPADSPAAIEMFLGALNFDGSPTQYGAMNIIAAVVYSTTLDAAQVAEVAGDMATL